MRSLSRRSWYTLTIATLALTAGLAISAAAVLGTPADDAAARAPAAAKLSAFGSCDSLRGYLRRHRAAVRSGPLTGPPIGAAEDGLETAPAADAPAAPPSGTNVQEQGVDEPDIVKASGETIFALAGDRLRTASTVAGTPAVLDSVVLPGGAGAVYGEDRELLVAGQRALVISRTYGPPPAPTPVTGDAIAPPEGYGYEPRTLLTELDVSDPSAIRVLATMRVEGSYVSARLTGATARVVVSAYPGVPLADRGQGRAWLPRAVLRDAAAAGPSRSRLVRCDDVRRPKRFSGATMLSVLTIDLERGLPAIDTDAVMTGGETVYASPSSLYVATERWHDGGTAAELPAGVTTAIHRFDTSDPRSTAYAGSGTVDGYMLSQWSMSEHDGVLRVASTSSPPWVGGGAEQSQSFVTTLVPGDDRLVEVGKLDGIGRGEQIYAVRFIGPSGYVVTFRQVDPLHVIDLADPADPRLAGELEIPGYSTYLHPIGPGLLLGIGQDADANGATSGAQASLFDVSDPANPVRTDQVSLGADSSTEVESDHHAFTWADEHDLAVVPVASWAGTGFQGAVGIRAGAGGLELTERTSHGAGPDDAIRRTLAIGGVLYTVSARGIAVHDPATLERLAFTPFAG
jgi:hypothetical protein